MDRTVEVLNNLLQGENMAVDSLNTFINKVGDENIKRTLQEVQSQHRENMSVLAKRIQDLGYEPREKLGLKGAMADLMINMDLIGEGGMSILNKVIEGENKGISRMADEISRSNLDSESKKIANQVLEEDRSSLAKMRRLRQQ
ncbi:MAG: PA2169 family four-helix-bundle protein [Clostridia bacterium]|nr:PA2169 family four-helix-bundle protein [Clostridia bacterium]